MHVVTGRFIAVLLTGALLGIGCESSPFEKKSSAPPVTLLEDEGGTTTSSDLPPAGNSSAGVAAPPVTPGLSLASGQRFPDIPLPDGLTTDTARTFVYESDTLTIGRMVYTTKASVTELAQFFINQAPLSGWTRVNLIEADGVDMLFTKPGKRLEVSAREASRNTSTLVVNLTPEGGTTYNQ